MIPNWAAGPLYLRVLLAIGLLCVAGLALWMASANDSESNKPPVYLMSTLPLKWGEGDVKDVAQGVSDPALFYSALVERYLIKDADGLDKIEASPDGMLIMVQPRLLAPSENVALDKWVRGGGRLVLFADPALQWESRFPLGDSRRPLFTSLLSPLLDQWGVQLALPVKDDAKPSEIDGSRIETLSRGFWLQHPHVERVPDCHTDRSALIAECRIGKGRVLLLADVDLLQDRYWTNNMLGGSDNRDWVLDLIDRMAKRRGIDGILWENLGG